MARIYRYSARDGAGRQVSGTVKAATDQEATSILRTKGLTPLTLTITRGEGMSGGLLAPPKVKPSELMIFTRQFATMISAGIPVFECLSILQVQTTDKNFRKILVNITEKVRSGGDLSEAMKDYPNAFPRVFVNMIAAGEASGQLEVILLRLADFIERSERLKRDIKGAMTYPVISLGMVLTITLFLLIFLVPKFKEIFDEIDIPLPMITRFVLGLSTVLREYWLMLGGVVIALFVVFKWYKKISNSNYKC